MDKRDYFMLCMKEGKYCDKRWVLRAFALVRETKTPEESEALDIIQTPAGFFYKHPESGELEQITGDVKVGKPLYDIISEEKEKLQVKKGELDTILKDEETDYGRMLYHCIIFRYSFGDKVPFNNVKLNMGAFEDELASKLDDEMEDISKEKSDRFYPRELIKYYEAMAYSRGLAMLCVPAATPKAMTIDPAILKRRDEIFNDPTVDMNDQAVAASVEKELSDMDKASFKGDPAANFLISGKDFKVIRKKRFISFGSSAGMTPDTATKYVKASLDQGVQINQFKDYNDEMRTGSYKRGVETMYGGELDKWLVRESSNIRVNPDDCGSTVGLPGVITEINKTQWLGYNIVDGKKFTKLDETNIGTYMGKVILRRSPATCWNEAPDYCAVCLGEKLSMNPDAISIAFSQYGHDFMGESMSAMHGKSLSIARMDFFNEVS